MSTTVDRGHTSSQNDAFLCKHPAREGDSTQPVVDVCDPSRLDLVKTTPILDRKSVAAGDKPYVCDCEPYIILPLPPKRPAPGSHGSTGR